MSSGIIKWVSDLILGRSLVAVIQEVRHSVFEIEDHLAKHAISPAKPVHLCQLTYLYAIGTRDIQNSNLTIVVTSLCRSMN